MKVVILTALLMLVVLFGLVLTGGTDTPWVDAQESQCVDTYIYLRAQPDGQWVQHEHPTTHPANNIAQIVQYTSKIRLVFEQPTANVLWVNTQPSAVMGHNNISIGTSGGLSALDIWFGNPAGEYINPHLITNDNHGFWVSIRGCL